MVKFVFRLRRGSTKEKEEDCADETESPPTGCDGARNNDQPVQLHRSKGSRTADKAGRIKRREEWFTCRLFSLQKR
jgi:hypothetical protein